MSEQAYPERLQILRRIVFQDQEAIAYLQSNVAAFDTDLGTLTKQFERRRDDILAGKAKRSAALDKRKAILAEHQKELDALISDHEEKIHKKQKPVKPAPEKPVR